MKLIIDIDDKDYEELKDGHIPLFSILDVIQNSIPFEQIRDEIEETYMNITYQENKDRKATWGLRKALQIIDKYR